MVHAPLLAKKTQLGHIFRLQNYHELAARKYHNSNQNTLLGMEGLALTTYKVDKEKGLITVMIINAGGSSSIAKTLKAGDPIIFMGPSGSPTEISKNKEVLFHTSSI